VILGLPGGRCMAGR